MSSSSIAPIVPQVLAFLSTALALCVATAQTAPAPYSSTYSPAASPPVLFRNATILNGAGVRFDDADLLIENGKIAALGRSLAAPANATIIDAKGRWLSPGIIDPHSHLGGNGTPHVWAHSDINEMTSPTTPQVWVEHSVWPQDPGFLAARAGGVTSLLILPGSANLIGGRGVLLKNVAATTYQEMKFPNAPQVLKMACGENPKRVYGEQKKTPSTLMGNVAGYREAFTKANNYRAKFRAWEKKGEGAPPDRDIGTDTLLDVMDGKILVQWHCYRADQMATVLDLAREFNFKIYAFHHAVEAYKIAPLLKSTGTCAALWADWYGFKLESHDGIRENVAIVDAVGACAMMHSDDETGIQHLNQEAAKAMAAGRRAGLLISPERAMTWLTSNPARALGVADKVGTLEAGKQADVVLWSRDPFSIYAQADLVYIDGALVHDRRRPQPHSDFSLGSTQRKEQP